MKKLTKIFLFASAICLGLGIILLAIGLKKNGSGPAWRLLNNSNNISGHAFRFKFDYGNDDADVSFVKHGEENTFESTNLENIDISIGAAHTIIKKSADSKIHIKNNSNQELESYISDKTLKIKTEDGFNFTNPEGVIVVELPSGLNLKKVEMDYGAAEIEAEDSLDIACEKFEIDLGAGDVRLGGIKTDKVDINIGAGSVSLSDTYVKDFSSDIGMGSIQFQGDITGNADIDCNMGSVDMDLDSVRDDHNFTYSVNAGSFTIDGKEFAGFGSSHDDDSDVDSQFDIKVSMGSVDISFARIL